MTRLSHMPSACQPVAAAQRPGGGSDQTLGDLTLARLHDSVLNIFQPASSPIADVPPHAHLTAHDSEPLRQPRSSSMSAHFPCLAHSSLIDGPKAVELFINVNTGKRPCSALNASHSPE